MLLIQIILKFITCITVVKYFSTEFVSLDKILGQQHKECSALLGLSEQVPEAANEGLAVNHSLTCSSWSPVIECIISHISGLALVILKYKSN